MFSGTLLLGALLLLGINAQVIDFGANGDSDPFGIFNWPFSPQFKVNFQQLTPWWKGPNICVERKESGEGADTTPEKESEEVELLEDIPKSFHAALTFSSCFETPDKYECVTKSNIHGDEKTYIVKYKCCYGYARRRFGTCEKQADLKPILEVLDVVNTTDFRRLLKTLGFDEKLTNGNYTLFAPINEALGNITDEISEMNKVEVVRRDASDSVKELLSNQIVPGFIDLNDYGNEDLLYSENSNNSIRLNFYPTPGGGRLVTANCIRIARANVFATNGLVHIVDKVVPSPKGSIEEMLEDPRVSSFKRALGAANMDDYFKDDHYTLFIPNNEAFDKLSEQTRNRLFSGSVCAATILKRHITPHTVCSEAIILNATVHDDNGDILNLEKKSEDEIYVESKARILEPDLLLTNGAVHIIDTVLIPDTALPIDEALAINNLTRFLQLAEEAGLKDQLNSMSNVTVFAPFDAAFDEPDVAKYIADIKEDKEKLKELILFHIVKGKLESSDMDASGVLETSVEGKTVPIKVYPLFSNAFFKPITPAPLVQCSSLTKFEQKACGSVVHEIDRILMPPSKTILELLESDPRLSTFRSLLDGTDTEEKLKDPNQNLTLIATTNYAFGRYKYNIEQLKNDKVLADSILKRHIIRRPVCCQQLEYGDQILNRWSPYSETYQNTQAIKDCNIIATNGILHTANTFMFQNLL